MVLFTWAVIEPKPALPKPVTSMEKTSTLNATATTPMNNTIGAILATVTTRLTIVASRIPVRMMKCTIQSSIDAATTACHVFPSPKDGKK